MLRSQQCLVETLACAGTDALQPTGSVAKPLPQRENRFGVQTVKWLVTLSALPGHCSRTTAVGICACAYALFRGLPPDVCLVREQQPESNIMCCAPFVDGRRSGALKSFEDQDCMVGQTAVNQQLVADWTSNFQTECDKCYIHSGGVRHA
jgi:hypothetical protein